MRSAVGLALLCSLFRAGEAAELVAFAAPPFLSGPVVSRSAFGATYAYAGRAPHASSELQITVVAVPPSLTAPASELPDHCLAAFRAELAAREHALHLDGALRRTPAGPVALLEQRWLARRGAVPTTGVVACGVHRGYFVAANYADELHSAVQSFPRLRAALAGLELRY
jgi:hypothetical protein